MQCDNASNNQWSQVIGVRADDTNCTFLHRFEQVGLGNGQTRVPDWTGVLKDRPHYSSVEVQQVPGRGICSPQLFEKVQTWRCLGSNGVNMFRPLLFAGHMDSRSLNTGTRLTCSAQRNRWRWIFRNWTHQHPTDFTKLGMKSWNDSVINWKWSCSTLYYINCENELDYDD